MARPSMQVGIIGAGVMAEAIIGGLLADRAIRPERLTASHPRRERREALAERHGVRSVAGNRDVLQGSDVVVLAVKPQMLGRVMRELRGRLAAEQVVCRSWRAPPWGPSSTASSTLPWCGRCRTRRARSAAG